MPFWGVTKFDKPTYIHKRRNVGKRESEQLAS